MVRDVIEGQMPFVSVGRDAVEKFDVLVVIKISTSAEFQSKEFGNKLPFLFSWQI